MYLAFTTGSVFVFLLRFVRMEPAVEVSAQFTGVHCIWLKVLHKTEVVSSLLTHVKTSSSN